MAIPRMRCGWTYDADMYDGITAAYFEAEVRHSTGAYTMGCELYNKTDSSQVGEVGTNSTSFNRQRTADIKANLVDGKVLGVRHKDGGGGYGYTTMGSLIIVQQNFTKSCSLLSTPQYIVATTSVHIPIMIRFTKADWSCKTTPTAKVFACCVIGNPGTNPSHWAAIRRHDQTTNIGVVNAITASAPYIQIVSADVYSILQTDDEYRGIASAYNDEGGANTPCYHFGLQVEYTLPVNRTLAASGSSYSVTGTAASLKKSSLVGAGAGSYSMTGTAATLTYTQTGPTLNAGIGSIYHDRNGSRAILFTYDGCRCRFLPRIRCIGRVILVAFNKCRGWIILRIRNSGHPFLYRISKNTDRRIGAFLCNGPNRRQDPQEVIEPCVCFARFVCRNRYGVRVTVFARNWPLLPVRIP